MKHLRSLFALAALALASVSQAADISITAANFRAGAGAKYEVGFAGVDITAGQLVAISPSTGKYVLADANDPALCIVAGIAGNDAKATRPLDVITYAPNMILGGTLSMTTPVYILSATAGGIAPVADLAPGGLYPNVVIVATCATPATVSTTTCVFRANAIVGTSVSVVAP